MMSIEDIIHGSTITNSLTAEERQQLFDIVLEHYKDDKIREEMEAEPRKKTAAELRKKYPVLKDAYDQYRMVLKLVQQEETEE